MAHGFSNRDLVNVDQDENLATLCPLIINSIEEMLSLHQFMRIESLCSSVLSCSLD